MRMGSDYRPGRHRLTILEPMTGNDDDPSEFRKAMRGVRPISGDKIRYERPRPKPAARFSRQDEREALEQSLSGPPYPGEIQSGDEMLWHRPGLARRTVNRLRRGQYAIEDECDLHGMTAEEARGLLAEFLDDAIRKGRHCVRIIHGKGRGSGIGGPVIKPLVGSLLRRNADVVAFCSARSADGGSGAVYVLLQS